MANVNNPALIRRIANLLSIKLAGDRLPTQSKDFIYPVLIANPLTSNIHRNTQTASSGATTLFTTSSTKPFFVTGVSISMACDAVSDCTEASIAVVIGGATRQLCRLVKLTTTAYDGVQTYTFPFPIELDKNTNITGSKTFTVGSNTFSFSVTGYEVDAE